MKNTDMKYNKVKTYLKLKTIKKDKAEIHLDFLDSCRTSRT